ncbi:MAG TPA: hypothetical protein VG944_10825 [Fimbriimonas sp.]|nr:hypothetical protein [Fimbriimonas sp.]
MFRRFFAALSLLTLLMLSAASFAQDVSIADLVNGTVAPSTMKISGLAPDYKAVRIKLAGDGGGSSISAIMMMAMSQSGPGGPGSAAPMMQVMGLGDLCWTKAATVHFGGHEFLVVYRLNTGLDAASAGLGAPKLAANLTLDLIRTDLIASIAPDPMTPDGLQKILKNAGVTLDAQPMRIAKGGREEAINAAILYPVFAQARQAALRTSTLSNGKQIGLALLIYSNDYDDHFPKAQSTADVRKATLPYTKDPNIWKTMNPRGGEFRFAMNLAGVSATSIESPATTVLVYESNEWPDGRRTVVFADGHAKLVGHEEWLQLSASLTKKFK